MADGDTDKAEPKPRKAPKKAAASPAGLRARTGLCIQTEDGEVEVAAGEITTIVPHDVAQGWLRAGILEEV